MPQSCSTECILFTCMNDTSLASCSSPISGTACTYNKIGNGLYNSECDSSQFLFDLYDSSTSGVETIYVESGNSATGTGTKVDPYKSISEAIRRIKYSNTTIYLLDSTHTLQKDSTNLLDSLKKRDYLELIIKPFYCDLILTGCVPVGTKPIIKLKDELVTFTIYDKLLIENVEFQHDHTLSCTGCTTCESFSPNEKSNFYKDDCDNFKNFEFFQVQDGGTLSLNVTFMQNVVFKNMIMEYKSLISIYGGSVQLTNVDFDHVLPQQTSCIIISGQSSNTVLSSFEYSGGTITLINYGYTINDISQMGGFLKLDSVENVTLSGLNIKENILISTSSAFFDMASIKSLTIEDCVVESNFMTNYLFALDQSDFSQTFQGQNENITLKNNSFQSNLISGLFYASKVTYCSLYNLSENNFTENVATSHLVHFQGDLKYDDIVNNTKSCSGDYGILINDTRFISNSADSYIHLSSALYCKLESLFIKYSSLKYTSVLDIVGSFGNDLVGMLDVNFKLTTPSSKGMIYAEISYRFDFDKVESLGIENVLLYVSWINSSNLKSLNISDSNGKSSNGFFYIENVGILTIEHMKLYSLKSTMSTIGSIKQNTNSISININNTEITSCEGSIKFESVKLLIIKGLQSISSISSKSATLSVKFGYSGSISISNSTFKNGQNGIIEVQSESPTAQVFSELTGLLISNMNSSHSLINIDQSVTLDQLKQNSISESTFNNNEGTIISISSSQGLLIFKSCNFTENKNTGNLINIQGTSNFEINGCSFTLNTASNILSSAISSSYSFIKSKYSTFESNSATVIYVEQSNYIDLGSIFASNSKDFGAVVYATNKGNIKMYDSIIENNFVTQSGVIYISESSEFYAENALFKNNSAVLKGGVLFSEKDSVLKFFGCLFTLNSANIGSSIFIQHVDHNNSYISSCEFYENSAETFGCIYLLESSLSINESYIYKNTALSSPSIVVMFSSKLYLSDIKMSNSQGEAALLSVESKSIANVYSTDFYGITLNEKKSFSAIKVYDSNFTCIGCSFNNVEFSEGFLITCSQYSVCSFESCQLNKIYGGKYNSIISIDSYSSINFKTSSIIDYSGVGIYQGSNTSSQVTKSNFKCKT